MHFLSPKSSMRLPTYLLASPKVSLSDHLLLLDFDNIIRM